MPWRGLSIGSPTSQGIAVAGFCSGDVFGRGPPSFSSVIDLLRLAARLDCILFGLLLPGLEFAVRRIDGGGEISPSDVLGEDTKIGNLASTIGRDICDLSIDLRGVLFPMRFVSSVKLNPRLPRTPSDASVVAADGGSVSGEDALERRSGSSAARSPMDVFDRFRRIEAMRCGVVACCYRILETCAVAGFVR